RSFHLEIFSPVTRRCSRSQRHRRPLNCAAAGAGGEGRRRPAPCPSHDGATRRWRRLNGRGAVAATSAATPAGAQGRHQVDLILHLAELAPLVRWSCPAYCPFLPQIGMSRPPTFSRWGPRRGRRDEAAPNSAATGTTTGALNLFPPRQLVAVYPAPRGLPAARLHPTSTSLCRDPNPVWAPSSSRQLLLRTAVRPCP
ncbi:unnamed protein product, partial [Urochloa humidicola]